MRDLAPDLTAYRTCPVCAWGLVVRIPWHRLRPPLDEIQRQSDGKDCELSNQEFFPTPFPQKPPMASLDNWRVDMPIPPDDST